MSSWFGCGEGRADLTDPKRFYDAGVEHEYQNEIDDAITCYERAAKLWKRQDREDETEDPQEFDCLMALQRLYVQRNDIDNAWRITLKSNFESEDNLNTYWKLGQIAAYQRKYDKAVELYRLAIANANEQNIVTLVTELTDALVARAYERADTENTIGSLLRDARTQCEYVAYHLLWGDALGNNTRAGVRQLFKSMLCIIAFNGDPDRTFYHDLIINYPLFEYYHENAYCKQFMNVVYKAQTTQGKEKNTEFFDEKVQKILPRESFLLDHTTTRLLHLIRARHFVDS